MVPQRKSDETAQLVGSRHLNDRMDEDFAIVMIEWCMYSAHFAHCVTPEMITSSMTWFA